MKRAICVLLASCTLVAVAEEPKQPASPAPDGTDWLQFKVPHNQVFGFNGGERGIRLLESSGTCYFIRTLRPVLPDSDAQRSGFIKLQARVTGVESGPVCTMKWPLIRAQQKLTTGPVASQPGSQSSR